MLWLSEPRHSFGARFPEARAPPSSERLCSLTVLLRGGGSLECVAFYGRRDARIRKPPELSKQVERVTSSAASTGTMLASLIGGTILTRVSPDSDGRQIPLRQRPPPRRRLHRLGP